MNLQQNQPVATFEALLAASVERLDLRGRRVLAAVSGGGDSVALALGLHRLHVWFELAVIDHGLRPFERELDLVHSLARSLGVSVHVRKVQLPAHSGVESAARAARYAALAGLAHERSLDVVATAHTATDQAETVLLRLGRGAALGGAAGVLERRADGVVRPMLSVTRAQARDYLTALGQPCIEDPMNDDPRFTRVRVRQTLLPALETTLGPTAVGAIARFAATAFEDDALLERMAVQALARATLADGALDRVAVLALEAPIARRVLNLVLERAALPVDAALLDGCLSSIAGGTVATLPHDRVLATSGGVVRIEPAPPRKGAG